MKAFNRFLDVITRITGIMAGILLFIPVFAIFYEVISRGVFNQPTEWATEISTYCVLMAGFLGMGTALAKGRHIHVDMVISHLSERTNIILRIVSCIICIIFTVIFCWKSAEMAYMSYDLDMLAASTLRMPLWIPQLSLPVGTIVLLLQFVRMLIENVQALASHGEKKGGAAA
ncbi:MAG: TRAP transporter small permease [Acidaminococcus sp.]|jgi:TRAP-type C4-dicarboxylate transport system permease small subunit|nr:TRAP transporter small permease [Acidaminococcus sp.]MCI2099677.1 TRAP transporter small permease [Acidaminococcus sp.]MCI2113918.1 TRAP transporter small permease [Acidaminococcus sp.]MCI2115845.1 TRAP transporter small permease [Acidaminococcus sp.]